MKHVNIYICKTQKSPKRLNGTAMESGWVDKWEENGWKTSKNTPVRDSEKWSLMRKFLIGHDFRFVTGKHEYLEWMNREIIKKESERERKDV